MQNLIGRLKSQRIVAVAVLALILLVWSATVTGQGPKDDALTAALVSELRQLRLAIENLSSVNSRMQILSMRANQQEQRLSSVSSQLFSMKAKLTETSAEVNFATTHLEQLKERIRVEVDPKVRDVLEMEQKGATQNLESIRLKQASVQEQVSDLTTQTTTEKDRLG